MDYQEQKRLAELKSGLQQERTTELQLLRDTSSRERDINRFEHRQELTEIQQKQLLELEILRNKLLPEKLDSEFFDHERRLRVEHFYHELKHESEARRSREAKLDDAELSMIKDAYKEKLRSKYSPEDLSSEEIKQIVDNCID